MSFSFQSLIIANLKFLKFDFFFFRITVERQFLNTATWSPHDTLFDTIHIENKINSQPLKQLFFSMQTSSIEETIECVPVSPLCCKPPR